MALTPDDVVTKQFHPVRFKEGFDPEEVDDFLDEIVVEWRKALDENAALKAKLAAYESGDATATSVTETETVAEIPAVAPIPEVAPAAAAAAPASSAGIIELAQRLHDEHVAEGKSQGEQLVSDARAQAAQIVSEAEEKARAEKARLDDERRGLESRITELRGFERDYRTNLRKYIEGQLQDLDKSGTASGDTPVSAIGL